jgi:hypothetical protein
MAPFLVVLQSHFLDVIPTTVVAPMLTVRPAPAYTKTAATVRFNNRVYTISAAELAAVETRRLGRSLGNLREFEDDIRHAINFVFVGL